MRIEQTMATQPNLHSTAERAVMAVEPVAADASFTPPAPTAFARAKNPADTIIDAPARLGDVYTPAVLQPAMTYNNNGKPVADLDISVDPNAPVRKGNRAADSFEQTMLLPPATYGRAKTR